MRLGRVRDILRCSVIHAAKHGFWFGRDFGVYYLRRPRDRLLRLVRPRST